MKILVVEDEPTLNKIIAKRLKIEAYSVDCAFNGKEWEEENSLRFKLALTK